MLIKDMIYHDLNNDDANHEAFILSGTKQKQAENFKQDWKRLYSTFGFK